MSQQEMHYSETSRQQAEQDYSTYDGLPPHNPSQSQFSAPYGQKLSSPTESQHPSPGQRLALAIVSLAMLMVMTFALIGIGIGTQAGAVSTVGLVFVLVLFFVAVIVINSLFNYKR